MSIIDRVLSIVAPHDCIGCSAEGRLLCQVCISQLPAVAPKILAGSELKQVHCATVYKGLAKDLIWRLKSSGAQEAARIMAKKMTQFLPPSKNYIIIPVPTATGRIRQRGYDQARLLAREISRQTGMRYINCLARTGQAHQVGSLQAQRLRQLATAFRVKNINSVAGQNIILVDDVVTTGASLEAAAKILKNAGAHKIAALTFARPIFRKEEQRRD